MSAALPARGRPSTERFPPVVELLVASLALVVVGGIVMASYIPRRPPLGLPVLLLGASAVLLGAALVVLIRLHDFAWGRFRLVFGWALLAYLVSAAMIEYAFVKDDTRGGPLLVVSLMLVVYAVDVPLIIAATVARHADSDNGT